MMALVLNGIPNVYMCISHGLLYGCVNNLFGIEAISLFGPLVQALGFFTGMGGAGSFFVSGL